MQAQTTLDCDLTTIRSQVSVALNRLGAQLIERVSDARTTIANDRVRMDRETERLQARVAALGQIAAGLAVIDQDCLPPEGAGYGSTVVVKDIDTGFMEEYMLMVGSLVDIEANQVSLASPIGRALLGRMPGDEITIGTPQRPLRLRVTGVTTLMESLEENVLHAE